MIAQRTRNARLIKSILTTPQIYEEITEDVAPSAEDFEPQLTPGIEYVMILDDDRGIIGLFILIRQNFVLAEIHTCLLPTHRGKTALEAAQTMIQWIWSETHYQRFITTVPVYNKKAIWFAGRSGMVRYGLNPKSYLKKGCLWDSVLLGMSRPEGDVKCLQ